ncbi:MAG: hypothetical protein P1V81_12560 [Planctomycetota bacterium]|nr:hypothetical protein [Planctomycetota bacterium]
MDSGISRIHLTAGTTRADRVAPMKEREREELADFAEELEHRDDDSPPAPTPEHPRRDEAPSVGYPTDDESGSSLDLKA